MKRFRLLVAAAFFALFTTACSSDLVGPVPGQPSFDETTEGGTTGPVTPPPNGQGGFGSGG
jgi:hypothetical protein